MIDETDLTAAAVRVVARDAIARILAYAEEELDWGDYPEIGEHDWGQVVEAVRQMSSPKPPDKSTFNAAYQILKARANHE